MRRNLVLILLFVFIDVLGFSLILPLLPYYAQSFGATPRPSACCWAPTP